MPLRKCGTTLFYMVWMLSGVGLAHAEGRTNVADLTTAHFILHVEGLDPVETGLFLEAAFVQMTNFFKVEPDRKILFKVFATRAGYQSELDRMRGLFAVGKLEKLQEANGAYLRETATAYTYLQFGDYNTRGQLIYLLALQFSDFVQPWGYVPSLQDCDHGLAQYFALHNWDGEAMQVGIVPPIAPNDYPRMALDHFRKQFGRDLQGIVDGKRRLDVPVAWGLVSFLVGQHRSRFDLWRKGLGHDVDPPVAWRKQFGSVTPEFTAAFESWLERNAPPWKPLAGEWQPWGAAIEGRPVGPGWAGAILAEAPQHLSVTLNWPSTNASAGVIFGLRRRDDFRVLQRGPGAEWALLHYHGDQVRVEERPVFPTSIQRDFITVEPTGGVTKLTINGQTMLVTNMPGSVGVYTKGGPTRFWCQWEQSSKEAAR